MPSHRPCQIAHVDILSLIVVLIPLLLLPDPIPENTSILTGKLHYEEIYNHGNKARFLDVTRFTTKEDFDVLACCDFDMLS